jgi:hypothetical protein
MKPSLSLAFFIALLVVETAAIGTLSLADVNSDTLQLIDLYRDLASGAGVSEWSLSGPSLPIEAPLFFFCLHVAPSVAWAHVFYDVALWGLIAAALTMVASALGCRRGAACALVPLVVMLPLWAIIPWHGLFLLQHHATMLPVTLFLLWLTAHSTALGGGARMMAAVALGALCGGFDPILVPHAFVPAGLAVAISFQAGRLDGRALARGLATVGLQLGGTLAVRLTAERHLHLIHTRRSSLSVPAELTQMAEDLFARRAMLAVPAALLLAATVTGLVAWRRALVQPRDPTSAVRLQLELSLILSMLAAAIAPPLAHRWLGIVRLRYLEPALLLPPFLLAVLISRRAPWARNAAMVAAAIAVVCAGRLAWRAASSGVALPYDERVACVDRVAGEEKLMFGYADYWNARRLTILSHQGIRMNQLDGRLAAFPWLNNQAWYRRALELSPDAFLLITEGLPEALALERLGPPEGTRDCDGIHVLIYRGHRFVPDDVPMLK